MVTTTTARGRYPSIAAIPVVPQTTLVIEQGNLAIATAVPFGSTILPAEGSTVEPDGTPMAQLDPAAACEATARDAVASTHKTTAITIATTTAIGRILEAARWTPTGQRFLGLAPPRRRKE
jgi:hypothetical protein